MAAGRPCYNLDTFLIEKSAVLHSFLFHSQHCDISVIEGNRGLFDGIDLQGRTSTAEIAKLLCAPVLLCVDCTKTTRTMAALIMGCMHFDPDVKVAGVILNRIAGPRHRNILVKSIEHHCGIPVLGAIPKLRSQDFPERHMGLIPTPEHMEARKSIETAAGIAREHIDLDGIMQVACQVSSCFGPVHGSHKPSSISEDASSSLSSGSCSAQIVPKIGILKDEAFQFYYPDNIEALQDAGAETIFISPLADKHLPDLDALYMGGGFPETHAAELARNDSFRNHLKLLAEAGLPIYAECGGLIYLGEKMVLQDCSHPMTGVLPIVFGLSKKPQGHGYTVLKVDRKNPYFETGTEIKGHEFRYSKVLECDINDTDMAYRMIRGTGIKDGKDGICYKNILATYTHIHALGTPAWASSMVRNALAYRKGKIK
jgi:cobyrinic acid a,c-diamide synthase